MNEKHNGIFTGQIKTKRHKAYKSWGIEPCVITTWDIKREKIAECEFDRPPLMRNDDIHIHELNLIVKIEKAIRSTNGGYVYDTDYVIKEIEDGETLLSKERAEQEVNEYFAKKEQRKQENIQNNNKSNKKWYQFWK